MITFCFQQLVISISTKLIKTINKRKYSHIEGNNGPYNFHMDNIDTNPITNPIGMIKLFINNNLKSSKV